MQTYQQTVAGAQTIQLNVTGRYFTILLTSLGLNVRFFKNSKKKDLGDIKNLLSGLEVWFEVGDEFDRVEIDTFGADTIQIGIGNGQARYNRSQGNVAVTNTANVLVANPIANPVIIVDKGDSYGANYKSTTTLAALAPDVVFTAAANVNGAIIQRVSYSSWHATSGGFGAFIAKATAPTTLIDGDVICSADSISFIGTQQEDSGKLEAPIKIAAGKGLYFMTDLAESRALRSVLYTFL
jgi:hypothetical protein